MPEDIVLAMDPKFTSKAWKTFCDDNNIYQSMSNVYYARTDGQSEVGNKAIIQQIKQLVYDGESNWPHELPNIQAVLN